MMKKGFTLVELSIVLVIIGLLIGGILVAQSLVASTEINSQIRQLSQFDAAVASFQSRYNGLPGDSSKMTCSWSYCNDGTVTTNTTINASLIGTWSYGEEPANFWPDLEKAGLATGESYTSTLPAGGFNTGTSKNAPASIISPENGSILLAGVHVNYPTREFFNFYQIADYSAMNSGAAHIQRNAAPVFTPIQALALDTKLDNGLQNTGIVRNVGYGSGQLYYAYGSDDSNCTSGANYLANDTISCVPIIQLMGSTGWE